MPRVAVAYLTGVSLLAVVVLAVLAGRQPSIGDWTIVLVLAVLTVVGELRPIRVPMGAVGIEITVSTAFGFALTLQYGAFAGCAAMAVAALVADTAAGKVAWKALFNASQYVLAMAAGGVVLELFSNSALHRGGQPIFTSAWELIPFVLASAAFFVTNILVLAVALALVGRMPILKVLREDFAYQWMATATLLALSPICVVVAQRSLALLPILLIPLVAAYKTALVSLEKEHQALHDALTGLPNRTLLRSRLVEATTERGRRGGSAAVLLIDLDRFKEINDSLGHATGDRVLQAIGPRLQEVVGDEVTVARLGGDEFGVVLPLITRPEEAHELGRRLLDAIRRPVSLDELHLEVDASIGVAFYPGHGTDADTLMQHADVAMYAAKDNLAGVVEYDSTLDHSSPLQLMLVQHLREAVATGDGIVVHYQPKVDVATGRVAGAEALVRWHHRTRGLVRPDEFISVAERTGLIRELTVIVLEQAVAQCAAWRHAGHDLPVSVNISARTLLDLDLPTRIDELLTRYGVPPDRLILEITESTIMSDVARTSAQLTQLAEKGARISLDDYGTGHSSLAQVKSLPIVELKIDKSFITYMADNSDDAHIARSTIELGHRLGLRVVAEGVETADAWQLLQQMGCHQAQGYFFSRPLPADRFDRWLDAHDRRASAPRVLSTRPERPGPRPLPTPTPAWP